MKIRRNVSESKTVKLKDGDANRNISLSATNLSETKIESGNRRRLLHSPHPRSSPTAEFFPPYSIYVVVSLTLLLRVSIVINPGSWWILHPDEVYQSLEVAHTEMYGYGFRPYEYLEPPQLSPVSTSSERQHIALGMYSMRSWLHARLYMWIFFMGDFLSIATSRFVLAKIAHSVICGLLPLTVFRFLRVLNPSVNRDVAVMAAVLIGFTDYTVLLGTHTLINSLLSPALFFCMALYFSNCHQGSHSCGTTLRAKEVSTAENSEALLTTKTGNDKKCKTEFISNCNSCSLNRPFSCYYIAFTGLTSGVLIYVRPDISLTILAVNVAFTTKVTLSSLVYYSIGLALGIFFGGFDDYISYKLWFISPYQWLGFQYKYAGLLFGKQDLFFYVRELFFGSYTMCVLTVYVIVTMLLYLLVLGFLPSENILQRWFEDNVLVLRLNTKLFIVSFALTMFYSLQQHKEIRFAHDATVLFLCSAACSIYCLYQLIQGFLSSTGNNHLLKGLHLLLYAELHLYAIQSYYNYPSSLINQKTYHEIYHFNLESGRVNMCLNFISKQPDVTGLVIDYSIYLTGGYTILDKDIPIFAKTHYEFREWKHEDRQIMLSKPYFGNPKNVSVLLIDKVSNFITIENSRLLLKSVAKNSKYNYIIVTDGRKLPKKGFKKIYTVGSVSVYKRLKTRGAIDYLKTVAEDISLGDNSTILQYEASWLLTLDLPGQAKERLERALQINSKCVRCWQLLYVTLQRLDPQQAKLIPPKCYKNVGKEKCTKPTAKIVLHPEYNLGLNYPSISS